MASGGVYMGASDAFTWYMERDPALRSTVAAIVWLDRAPDWKLLTGRLDTAAVPDPDLMVACLAEGFAETTHLASS